MSAHRSVRLRLARVSLLVTVGVAGPAAATPVEGVYVGLGAGVAASGGGDIRVPGRAAAIRPAAIGPGVVGSVGWGFGNGLRAEVEGAFATHGRKRSKGADRFWSAGANLLFDLDLELPVQPYFGGGVGYGVLDDDGSESGGIRVRGSTRGRFVWQAIAGAAWPIDSVPGLALTLEYRYRAAGDGGGPVARVAGRDLDQHEAMVGVRYAFDRPMAVPERAPLAPPPAVAVVRTYLVFFGWNSAALDGRARDVVAQAARATPRLAHTRIEVTGHADGSGGALGNQRLSERRAAAVADELVGWGVARGEIDLHAFGDGRPLVPAAAGAREPQNRRVEIVYR